MKKILLNLLRIYCLLLMTALMVYGLKKVARPDEVVMPLLFLPVFGYVSISFSKIRNRVKLPLLGYSILFSIILMVAEIISLRKLSEGMIILVMIPLPILMIWDGIKSLKIVKEIFKQKEKVKKAEEPVSEVDETRRKFLKVAAGTSLATAVMYFLNRQKAGAAFFGSVPGPGTVSVKDSSGNKVDIAQKQPLDGYNISDMDTSGSTQYFGFLNKDNAWYILQVNSDNSMRYAKGLTNYSTPVTGAWATRTGQSYGTFGDIF